MSTHHRDRRLASQPLMTRPSDTQSSTTLIRGDLALVDAHRAALSEVSTATGDEVQQGSVARYL